MSDPKKECQCTPHQIQKYLSKISGPLLGRIDLHLEVPALPSHDLMANARAETSQAIKEHILKARALQKGRFAGSGAAANGYMSHRQIKEFCAMDNEGKELLKKAIDELGLSARTYDKILKVARTIADPAGSEQVQTEHLAEAIQYRSLDKNGWG